MKGRGVAGAVAVLALGTAALCHSYLFATPGARAGRPASAAHDDSIELLAATPPMGWNSWDGYGLTITEAQFKSNADWLAEHLKPYGWQYVVIDMDWFVPNPSVDEKKEAKQFSLDEFGRYIPATTRFPSAADGAGFKPLADHVHSLGLKFGIHILRGIPKAAVEKNLPIAGSNFHASDAADTSDVCPWTNDNYGVNTANPAAAAYYDSIAKLYASWGVDFLKVDCISAHPYRGDDIRLISAAIAKSGRPMVLSLSPGPAPLDKAAELRQYAQMWRVSDDVWDLWHSDQQFPQGLGDQFANVSKWALQGQPGHWPDADMLALGYLGPHPGWGEPRKTRFTHDEQRTLVSLWVIARSPLMVGGELPSADAWTESLLTNREIIAVDQHSNANHPVITTADTISWLASSDPAGDFYLAVFNMQDAKRRVQLSWNDLGLRRSVRRTRPVGSEEPRQRVGFSRNAWATWCRVLQAAPAARGRLSIASRSRKFRHLALRQFEV
jgi:alpha-galactosidase